MMYPNEPKNRTNLLSEDKRIAPSTTKKPDNQETELALIFNRKNNQVNHKAGLMNIESGHTS